MVVPVTDPFNIVAVADAVTPEPTDVWIPEKLNW